MCTGAHYLWNLSKKLNESQLSECFSCVLEGIKAVRN